MAKRKLYIAGMSEELSESISKNIEEENKNIFLPLANKRIGISVSDSDDYKELGFSETHQKDITIELTRYLLVNGSYLIYGGDLRNDGYTYAFSELSFQYRQKDKHDTVYYTNYFGWPIYNKLQNSDEADFKKNRVAIVKVDAPKDVPADLKNKFIFPDSFENKVLWAKSMSKMRVEMIKKTDGRIFIGGKLSVYKGYFPGIIEEGYLTLKAKQPMFLVGAFGGATNLMIRAIKGEDEKILTKEIFEQFPDVEKLYDYSGKEKLIAKLQEMFSAFKKLGIKGLCDINGLTKEQNIILFTTPHFHEIIYNILVGLKAALKK